MSNLYKYQTNVYGVCEEEMSYRETRCACFWDYLVPFIRFWGIISSVGKLYLISNYFLS